MAIILIGTEDDAPCFGAGVFATDCRRTHEELSAAGVEFLQPPTERPYGIEARLEDDSGSHDSFTRHTR